MKRLLIVVVAVLSLVSFSGAVMAQDSTSTAPSGTMTTPKKTMHRKHKTRKHHKVTHHTTAKADTTAAH